MKFTTQKRRAEFTHENYTPLRDCAPPRPMPVLRDLVKRHGSVTLAVFAEDGLTPEEFVMVDSAVIVGAEP